jgi:hypothetical protein
MMTRRRPVIDTACALLASALLIAFIHTAIHWSI